MPHSDSDTGSTAGVTAAAMERIEECRNGAAAYRATDKVAMIAGGVVLLADIAEAAGRLVQAIDADELQEGWRDEIEIGGDPTSAAWRDVLAAIRAVGEATP